MNYSSDKVARSLTAGVQILALPLAGCVTLDKLLNLSVPELSHLQNQDNDCIYPVESLWD